MILKACSAESPRFDASQPAATVSEPEQHEHKERRIDIDSGEVRNDGAGKRYLEDQSGDEPKVFRTKEADALEQIAHDDHSDEGDNLDENGFHGKSLGKKGCMPAERRYF